MDSLVPNRSVDLLVVAAHAPDLRGLREALGERLDGDVRGVHVTAKTVGLGMAVAGGLTAKRVFQLSPRAVVHLGTCGVYPGQGTYQPHDVIVADRITLVDHAVLAGKAVFPDPMPGEVMPDAMLTAGLANVAPVSKAPMAGTLAITADDALAAAVPQQVRAHGENLECFGVAHACQLAQVPYTSVLGVTHVVGGAWQADWRRFEKEAACAAARVIIGWLHAGAQGLPHGT